MRFKGLDLNLLAALEVLVTTRSITETARRMNLSQPAVSAALGRLREHFDDPLLVLNGKRFLPTTTAETLLPLVRQLLRDAETMLQAGRQFAPERSSRTFSVVASDYMTVVLLSRVAARLGSAAPNVRLNIIPPSMDSGRAIDNGSVDIIVGPEAFMVERFSSVKLFEERHVLIGCADNPLFAGAIDLQSYISAGHVISMFGPERELSFADRFVEKQGIARRVEVTAGSFVSLPWLVIGTSRVAVIQQRLAELIAKTAPIAISELPFPMPLQVVMMQCHPARSADKGLVWLMKLIAEMAEMTPTSVRMAG